MKETIFDGNDTIYSQIKTNECLDQEKRTIEKRSEVIGRLLTRMRMDREYTQQEISNTIGIAQQTYAGYERGRHEPSIEILIRIADIYGVSLDLITGRYVTTEIAFIQNAVLDEQIEISRDGDISEKTEQFEPRKRKKYNRVKKKQKP